MSKTLPAPMRLSVLTGFLGTGKTTLLNRILRDPAFVDTAVIVNEFGEVGIDHLLVERSGEEIIELSDGCVCCTVRGDLVDTLADIADRVQTGRLRPLSRVVIETTGLADPAPILASLMAHPALMQSYALGAVVALVDAHAGVPAVSGRREAERQIACADRIVLTKTDIAPASPALLRHLRALNKSAEPVDMAAFADHPGALLEGTLFDPETRKADLARWLGGGEGHAHDHHDHDHDHDHGAGRGHHHHDQPSRHGGVRSFALTEIAPIAGDALQEFLALLGQMQGERILRMKAVVCLREGPERPLVLHGVRGYLHPPVRLPEWPQGAERQSRLVLIGEDLDERLVRDLFSAFTGQPRSDAPDRTALEANPLAIPGFRP